MSDPATPNAPSDEEAHGHVVPGRVLLAVWGSLLALTAITVAASWLDLGSANLWVAMGIATAKAVLVALFFMHLRWERSFLGVIFLAGLLFVLLFVGLALLDTQSYKPDLIPGYAPGLQH